MGLLSDIKMDTFLRLKEKGEDGNDRRWKWEKMEMGEDEIRRRWKWKNVYETPFPFLITSVTKKMRF